MTDPYVFHDGMILGTQEQLEACEKFHDVLLGFQEGRELPYLIGSNDPASDLAAGMVSVVALTTGLCERTGGIPSDELAIFSHPDVGFMGFMKLTIEGETPEQWNPLAQYFHSVDIMRVAQECNATHVYMVNVVMLNMTSHNGKFSTDGASPMLRFVGWDIQRGFGMRWFARVSSTGNPRKPFHLIPWDKSDTSERYDWRTPIMSLGDRELPEDQMGDYFMSILKPGVETLSSFNEHEVIVPTQAYLDAMRDHFRKGDFGDVQDMIDEAAEQLAINADGIAKFYMSVESMLNGDKMLHGLPQKGLEA